MSSLFVFSVCCPLIFFLFVFSYHSASFLIPLWFYATFDKMALSAEVLELKTGLSSIEQLIENLLETVLDSKLSCLEPVAVEQSDCYCRRPWHVFFLVLMRCCERRTPPHFNLLSNVGGKDIHLVSVSSLAEL